MAIEYLYWGVATYLGYLEDEGIFSQMLDKYIKNIMLNKILYKKHNVK